ncbi:MAG: 4Fe-4S binding protein [Ruminococcus sp.]|nr:4Fe-4S binding protein [Ruminococcus sp.]
MKNKIHPIQTVRTIIQLISFVTVPALFITVFSSIGGIITSVISGSFVLNENLGRIILVLAVFLVTLLFGRYFCGFICSFGTMQDLLNAVGKLIPYKVKISEKADKYLKLLKYAVLAFVATGVWGFSVTGDSLWSPWTVFGIYTSLSAWSSLEYFLTLGGLLLLLIVIGSLFIERFFCKYLCPLGAIFSLLSRTRLYPVKRKSGKCGNCRLCTSKCAMSIPLHRYDEVSSGECINCMKCAENCPKDNISADTLPAITGVLAAAAIAGLFYAGAFTFVPKAAADNDTGAAVVEETTAAEETLSAGEQTVIGETAAVRETEKAEETEAVTETITAEDIGIPAGKYEDGVYTGTGTGFRGETKVTVTVENGEITDITVNSCQDDKQFFSSAESGVISEILQSQDTDVDAVSGATFSSNGIKEAVADALGIEFTNPNSTAEKGHGGRHSH